MKKGQLMQSPFFVIFSLIMIALILFFGIRTVVDVKKTSEITELLTFVDNLQKTINLYYNFDVGSRKLLELNVPAKVEKICFVDPSEDVNVGVDLYFANVLENNLFSNMFVIPLDVYPSPAPDFDIAHLRKGGDRNPLCIEIIDGVFRAEIENKYEGEESFVEIKDVQ